jgi:DNA polymerase-4
MSEARKRCIVHLDMDAFYASVEVLDDPSLKGLPVVVGGSERRGVVCAGSYEARAFGVRSAQPVATARRLCPQGIFLPVRMERYREISERVFGIFRRFTPLVEELSIDEAFLDVTASVRLFGSPESIARKIRAAVRKETGLTVSAGVAGSKLVAKIASDLGKPDGLTVVPRGKDREFLAPLPVGRLWGVGEVTRKALEAMGVRTIGDVGRLPKEALERKFGRNGLALHRLSLGIDDRDVETEREAKSIGREETYPEDLLDGETIRRELLSLSVRVASRMRRHGIKGKTVTLKVKYHDFTLVTRAVTLEAPTDDGGDIHGCAMKLLAKTEGGRRPVRLLGISLSGLGGEGTSNAAEKPFQLPLFGPPSGRRPPVRGGMPFPRPVVDPAKKEKLNKAVDRIREKYGDDLILPASLIDRNAERKPSS